MKRKDKFKKVKFERISLPLWVYGIIVIFPVSLVYMLYTSIVHKDIGMIFTSCIVLSLTVLAYWWYLKKVVFSSSRKIVEKIRWLIEQNKWYDAVVIDGVTKYTYLPMVLYKQEGNNIYIAFNLDGSSKSKQYRELETKLSDCFNMSCASVKEINAFCRYELVLDEYYDPLLCDGMTDFRTLCDREKVVLNHHLVWNWRKTPHALITGGTGSGKTYFLLYLLKCLKSVGADIKIIDPKRADLLKLGDKWDVKSVCEPAQIAQVLRETEQEMNRRYDLMNDIGVDFYVLGFKPMFVVFDEAMAFFGSVEKKEKDECKKYLLSIVAKGRQAGVNIILSAQRGDTEFLGGGAIRDQLGMRVAFGNLSDDGISMVFGNAYRDCKARFSGKGEGLIYIDGESSKPTDFKAPRLESAWDINVNLKKELVS